MWSNLNDKRNPIAANILKMVESELQKQIVKHKKDDKIAETMPEAELKFINIFMVLAICLLEMEFSILS